MAGKSCYHLKDKKKFYPTPDERYFYCPELRGDLEKLNPKTNAYLVANLVVYFFVYLDVYNAYKKIKTLEGSSHRELYQEMMRSMTIA